MRYTLTDVNEGEFCSVVIDGVQKLCLKPRQDPRVKHEGLVEVVEVLTGGWKHYLKEDTQAEYVNPYELQIWLER